MACAVLCCSPGFNIVYLALLLSPTCRAADLARPPTWREVAPLMKNGLLLSTRSLLAMGMLMWATRLIAGFGAVGLAGVCCLLCCTLRRPLAGQPSCAPMYLPAPAVVRLTMHSFALPRQPLVCLPFTCWPPPCCLPPSPTAPLASACCSPRDPAPDLGLLEPGLHLPRHCHTGGLACCVIGCALVAGRRCGCGHTKLCCWQLPVVRAHMGKPSHLFHSSPASLQSLVAFHLGKGDRRAAAAVFRRTLTLAVGAGLVITAALLAAQGSLPGVFTQDAAVIGQVALVLPLVAAFLPLDAAASVMDGVLLGSQEAGWLGKTMAVTAVVCTAGLLLSQRLAWPITGIWVVIKVRGGRTGRRRAC